MDNQVIQQILNTQTQMLQHLTTLQQQQAINNMNQTMSSGGNTSVYGTPLTGQTVSPVTPPSAMSVADPTQYGTYANPYDGGGRPPVGTQFDPRNFVNSSFNEAMSFNPANQSAEASSNYMHQQSRGVQMGAVNAIGGALSGGVGIGSLFIPGLVPGLVAGGAASMVVGGVANSMIGGARNALDYQNVLQQKGSQFISAFHSTNEFGGTGWGLNDQQQASRFLRELAPKEFMSNGDMQKVLSGAADNNLLKNVQDVKDFQKKFTDIVGAVKEITVSMNQTIDQATEFMGQMQQMGIMAKDMPLVAAQAKVLGSTMGISADQSSQYLLGTAQNITQGTGMNAAGVVKNLAESTFYTQNMWNNLPDDSPLKNYINNNGGVAGVTSNMNQSLTGFINTGQGKSLVAGLFGSAANIDADGHVTIDSNKLKGITSGNESVSQLTQDSRSKMSGLNSGQQVEMFGKLSEELTNMTSEDGTLLPQLIQKIVQAYQAQAAPGTKMSTQTALVQSGIVSNYNDAALYEQSLKAATDPQLKAIYDARTIKQQDDAHALANTPSLFQRAQYWGERNFVAPFANAGQDVSDTVGQAMQGYQKWLTGMSDRSTVNATSLEDFSLSGLQKEMDKSKNMNANAQKVSGYLNDRANELSGTDIFAASQKTRDALAIQEGIDTPGKVNKSKNDATFDSGTYDLYMDQAWKGQLDPASLAKLNKQKLGLMDSTRRAMVEQADTGQYDGFFGKINYGLDEAGYGLLSAGDWMLNHAPANMFGLMDDSPTSSNGKLTYKSMQTQQSALEKEKKQLNQDMASLFVSKDMKGLSQTDLKKLQDAITSGKTEDVKSITSNKQAADLADRAKSLSGLDSSFTKEMGSYTEMSQYTKALANSGNLMGDKFNSAGVDSRFIDDLLGDVKSQGKSLSKNMDKMSLSDMKDQDTALLKKYDAVFASLPEYTKEQMAAYLQKQNAHFDMKTITSSDGNSIDSSKLENVLLEQIRNENLTPKTSSSSKKKANDSDVVNAAKDHTQAMYKFLEAFQQETGMLNDVSNGIPVTNYSSTGTR